MDIRPLAPQSIPDFCQLNREFNGSDTASVQQMETAFSPLMEEIILLAYVESHPAGFICGRIYSSLCYTQPTGELTELYVSEALREKGVATALVQALENAFREKSVHEITLLTSAKNFPAQGLYKRCGFQQSDELHFEKTL